MILLRKREKDLFVVEDVRRKVEDDVEHDGLGGKCRAAVFRQRVSRGLVVNVIGSKTTKEHVGDSVWNREPFGCFSLCQSFFFFWFVCLFVDLLKKASG